MRVPAVSIVLPTRNRLALVRLLLEEWIAQSPAGDVELIVVDDGSTDGTAGYLAEGAQRGLWITVTGTGRGPAAARNAGVRRARADVIAMTDDDCRVPADWALRLQRRLMETGADVVGGAVRVDPRAPLPSRLSQAITNGFVTAGARDAEPFLTSNNVAYRRRAIEEAGLFDETFPAAGGEERELHQRLRARGGRLVYAPDIVVVHRPALGWRGFVRQQSAYGAGARLFYRRGRRLGAHRPRRFSARRYTRALFGAMAELAPRDRLVFAPAFVLSQAAVAWGYFRSAVNQPD
jgi:glycosyltransferase involved in cell wall biosynthesis